MVDGMLSQKADGVSERSRAAGLEATQVLISRDETFLNDALRLGILGDLAHDEVIKLPLPAVRRTRAQ